MKEIPVIPGGNEPGLGFRRRGGVPKSEGREDLGAWWAGREQNLDEGLTPCVPVEVIGHRERLKSSKMTLMRVLGAL